MGYRPKPIRVIKPIRKRGTVFVECTAQAISHIIAWIRAAPIGKAMYKRAGKYSTRKRSQELLEAEDASEGVDVDDDMEESDDDGAQGDRAEESDATEQGGNASASVEPCADRL